MSRLLGTQEPSEYTRPCGPFLTTQAGALQCPGWETHVCYQGEVGGTDSGWVVTPAGFHAGFFHAGPGLGHRAAASLLCHL